jgi:hypothetical protein
VGNFVCTSCSAQNFKGSFKKNTERELSRLPAQKLRRVAAIGVTQSDSKELSHGLAWAVAL